MRPNQEGGASLFSRGANSSSLGCGEAANKQLYADSEWGKKATRCGGMLSRKQLSWSEKRGLPAGCRSGGRCNKGNRRLTGTHIPLQEAQHRFAPLEVAKDRLNRRGLISGPSRSCAVLRLMRECRTNRRLNPLAVWARNFYMRRASACAATAAPNECQLHRKKFIKGEPPQRSISLQEFVRPVCLLDCSGQWHQPMTFPNLVREWVA
jgi:hypothetical protein